MATPANRDVIRPARGSVDYFTENIKFFKEGEVFMDTVTEPAAPKLYIKHQNDVKELF